MTYTQLTDTRTGTLEVGTLQIPRPGSDEVPVLVSAHACPPPSRTR